MNRQLSLLMIVLLASATHAEEDSDSGSDTEVPSIKSKPLTADPDITAQKFARDITNFEATAQALKEHIESIKLTISHQVAKDKALVKKLESIHTGAPDPNDSDTKSIESHNTEEPT